MAVKLEFSCNYSQQSLSWLVLDLDQWHVRPADSWASWWTSCSYLRKKPHTEFLLLIRIFLSLTRSSFYVRAGNCEWESELELARVHVHLQKRRMYTADYLRTCHLLTSRTYVCPSICVSPCYIGSIWNRSRKLFSGIDYIDLYSLDDENTVTVLAFLYDFTHSR